MKEGVKGAKGEKKSNKEERTVGAAKTPTP